jgi:endo-1,4-beta-mannosidase
MRFWPNYKHIGIIICILFTLVFINNALARDAQGWVTIQNNTLAKDNRSFKFIGANAVNLVFYDDWGLDAQKAILQAKENNLPVLRLYLNWGWGKPEDFDKIIDSASKNGIYLILVFTDCCCSSDYSSPEKYFQVHAPFCNVTNAQSRAAFKRLIKQIIQRKNSINGRIYRDEPAILAWEVANELEYWRFSGPQVRAWIEDIAGYIKTLDKRHLVTIGISTNNLESVSNEDLAGSFGVAALDFFSFHFYPPSPPSGEKALSKEELLANTQKIDVVTKKFLSLGKPVVMAELGLSNSEQWNEKIRDDSQTSGRYALILKAYIDEAFLAGCSGTMFWGWGIPEASSVPMWWSKEDHSVVNNELCQFLKNYRIPSVR